MAYRRSGRELPNRIKLAVPRIGEVYGRLTVIGNGKTGHNGKRRWLFRCQCGTEKEQFAHRVVSGEIESCGCLMREAVSKANTKYADRLMKYRVCIINKYKQHARKKNRPFLLTDDEFFALLSQPCAYCGRRDISNQRNGYGGLAYNGVDRIDSSLGYIPENCVSCCRVCNVMKQQLTVAEFIAHLKLIIKHYKGST